MKTKLEAAWEIAKTVACKWCTLMGLYAAVGACVTGVVIYVSGVIDYLNGDD